MERESFFWGQIYMEFSVEYFLIVCYILRCEHANHFYLHNRSRRTMPIVQTIILNTK